MCSQNRFRKTTFHTAEVTLSAAPGAEDHNWLIHAALWKKWHENRKKTKGAAVVCSGKLQINFC